MTEENTGAQDEAATESKSEEDGPRCNCLMCSVRSFTNLGIEVNLDDPESLRDALVSAIDKLAPEISGKMKELRDQVKASKALLDEREEGYEKLADTIAQSIEDAVQGEVAHTGIVLEMVLRNLMRRAVDRTLEGGPTGPGELPADRKRMVATVGSMAKMFRSLGNDLPTVEETLKGLSGLVRDGRPQKDEKAE